MPCSVPSYSLFLSYTIIYFERQTWVYLVAVALQQDTIQKHITHKYFRVRKNENTRRVSVTVLRSSRGVQSAQEAILFSTEYTRV
jgi:hypothetical protein